MTSQDTKDLPSTVDDLDGDPILYGEGREYRRGRRMVPPPRVAFEDRNTRNTRVGWVAPSGKKFICHICYEYDHVLTQCTTPAEDTRRICANYERLTEEERKTVPNDSYLAAKYYQQLRESRNATGPNMSTTGNLPNNHNAADAEYPKAAGPSNPGKV